MFDALRGPHDRLLAKLIAAGHSARFLGTPGLETPSPLAPTLRALTGDEFDVLAAIVDGSPAHGEFKHASAFEAAPPVRRLLEPFRDTPARLDVLDSAWAKKQIESRLRGVDAEAFDELVTALEDERTRRAPPPTP